MDLRIISVPYDSSARGKRMGAGPERLLAAGLAERLNLICRRTQVEECTPPAGIMPAEVRTAFDLNRAIAAQVREAETAGQFPLVLAGNCISSVGMLAGLGIEPIGVFWFDAHGDFNTPETTIGGFLDGMATATIAGRCWKQMAAGVPGFCPVAEENVVLVGTRDLDPLEAKLIAHSAVTLLGPGDVDTQLARALREVSARVRDVYVHLDLDVLDPSEGRANEFAVEGGLSLQGVESALRLIAGSLRIRGASLTAYDPSYDDTGSVCRAAFRLVEALMTCITT